MNPPKFQGSLEPVKDPNWLSNIERVFQIMPGNKEDKMTFDLHMIKGPTASWWGNSLTLMTNEEVPKDW